MAATAATLAIGIYSAVEGNQQRQRAKGEAAKLKKEQDELAAKSQVDMPDTAGDAARAAQQSSMATAAARRRAVGKSGRQSTIKSGPRGDNTQAPTERKTLLGL